MVFLGVAMFFLGGCYGVAKCYYCHAIVLLWFC